MYHGVRQTISKPSYRLGLALLDLEDPTKVLRRSEGWIFGPREMYERSGDVNDVVFPCGWVVVELPAVVRAVAAIRADLARARAARADLDDATAASVERDAAALEARARAVQRATLSGGLAGDVRGALEPAIAGLAKGSRSAFSRPAC